jgi:phosphatidylinositol 4-kinase
MATFKVKAFDESNISTESLSKQEDGEPHIIDKSVIFKVGDDCRQDVLALQLISIFKEIYKAAHLDLYLYPYRVVATAPGVSQNSAIIVRA